MLAKCHPQKFITTGCKQPESILRTHYSDTTDLTLSTDEYQSFNTLLLTF